jgi:hypothetical protein
MKFSLPCLFALALVGQIQARAEIRIPNSVHTLAEIDKATEAATKGEKPLIFVVTDPGST